MTGAPEIAIVPDDLRAAHAAHRVVPFVGAGLSSAIVDDRDQSPPGYVEFVTELIRRADDRHVDAARKERWLEQLEIDSASAVVPISQELRRAVPDDHFNRIVRSIFKGVEPKPSQHHVILSLLGFRVLLTTNYDRILDQTLHPRPEVLTYRDLGTLLHVLEHEIDELREFAPIVVKLNGDVSVPSTIALGRSAELGMWDPARPLGADLRHTFKVIMSRFSLLFLGYSFSVPAFRTLLCDVGAELGPACRQHYAAVDENSWARQPERERLQTQARLFPLIYRLAIGGDANPHRGLWQFLSQLSSHNLLTFEKGRQVGSFFLPAERPIYLEYQREFEALASGFRYITPKLTNAIATEQYLEVVARAQLTARYRNVISADAWEQWIESVIGLMQQRRLLFEGRLRAGAEARILCNFNDAIGEIATADDVVVDRYRWLLDMLLQQDYDIELRLTRGVAERRTVTSYASLIRPHDKGSDVAAAYATQATTAEFDTQIFGVNTRFAHDMLLTFEKEWVRAMSESESVDALRRALHAC